ncbi:cellulose-binding domain-containing protein [Allonocardiopsis opalescens]|uniref:Cellulose binding domain-containing protein n=1 Tax=Allonocardiopsis opalescens TaxID=1144618 RepID=A0A2T0QFQ3_9ACTN|nr:cellulose-binding domain-containing protein [Allonocardiopsis opalescens]PRY02735.1 cellulose binding domain-containing protein [Allonocardiopsis opalescens]
MRFHRHRPRLLALAALVAVAGLFTAALPAQAGAAETVRPFADEEDTGADCPVPDPGSTPASSLLPDPFTRIDGTRVSTREDWRCRRAEIREQAERSVYGQKPAPPAGVTGTVSRTGITVNVTDQGRSSSFSASVSLPSGSGPFPAVVVLGGMGADTATINAAGAAVINFDPYAVGREGTPRNNKSGAFYSIYGSNSGTGLLMAWSWGVSRIIDVIEQSDGSILRANATGVTGCSRFGKGAFVAGAFDERIALTMPIESGTAGVPIFRGVAQESGAQPLSSAYSEQPWLGDAFGSFTGSPANLPVDTHQIVGMIAPRGLFIMENPHVDWLGSQSGAVGALGGAEVYRALGAGSNISYWSDVQDGNHCAVRPEWRAPLQQSIQAFLRGSGSGPGVIRVSPREPADLSRWRNWQTPVLTSGGEDPGGEDPGEPTGACTATHRTVSSWSGGFQGEVAVRNTGTGPLNGWTVDMTLAAGQSISNLWNGERTGTGGTVRVRNNAWNGTIPADGTVTFGFVATGGTAPPGGITCSSP